MSEADARRAELEARNAALRGRIDSMLTDLRNRTKRLGALRDEAAQRVTEVTSQDGLVMVRMDAAGTLRELLLSPKAFERTTPERLARTITAVIREASGGVHQNMRDTFGPMTETGPEISEAVPGMPSFQDLLGDLGPLVSPPDPATERARQAGDVPQTSSPQRPTTGPSQPVRPVTGPQPRTRSPRKPDDFDDDPPGSFLVGGKW